jgi:hypothetical protein
MRSVSLQLDSVSQRMLVGKAGARDSAAACASGGRDGTSASEITDKKGRGRPRLYDTDIVKGLGPRRRADFDGDGEQQARKRQRGAKPKYEYDTLEEATARRRERNRETALSSYYKRKAYITQLRQEIEKLQSERAALFKARALVASDAQRAVVVRTALQCAGSAILALQQLGIS